MPCYLIAGYSNHERSIFYETVHGNFVAIINEEKSFNSDEWTCTHHIMIPNLKKFEERRRTDYKVFELPYKL